LVFFLRYIHLYKVTSQGIQFSKRWSLLLHLYINQMKLHLYINQVKLHFYINQVNNYRFHEACCKKSLKIPKG
jgi:hypothetical protein